MSNLRYCLQISLIMNKSKLVLAFIPILLIITALIAAIIFLPSNFDIRNRAANFQISYPTQTLTPVAPTPVPQPTPVICPWYTFGCRVLTPRITPTPVIQPIITTRPSSLPLYTPTTRICTTLYQPVCGTQGGDLVSFPSACDAQNAG